MKFPYFLLSWHWDRFGKHPQPILRAFLRAVLAELWWKRHLRHLRKKTKVFDKFKSLQEEHIENFKGKYLTIKLPNLSSGITKDTYRDMEGKSKEKP